MSEHPPHDLPDGADYLFLPCAAGSEPWLAEECQAICGPDARVEPGRGGVMVTATVENAMRLNLHSRLAQRVLWPVIDGPYEHEHHLYELARRVRWNDWITPQDTLRVDVSATRSPLRSLNFAALRIKDAICDDLREATGQRPSVDTRWPDLAVSLHVGEFHAYLAVDLSGEALFKRGWREQQGEAPLKETLAATMLAAAGWHGRAEDGPLMDPCCGAGTIAIEAAQIACGIAPGLTRRFAFERLRPFRPHAQRWAALKQQAQAAQHPPAVKIRAGDVSFRMTDYAQRNAERAGVADVIEFRGGDALQRMSPCTVAGVMLLNPPYGERIGVGGVAGQGEQARFGQREVAQTEDGGEFFSQLATHWKRNFSGWSAWVLTPDLKLPSKMRLKESRRVPMWNGPIECRMFRFDMVKGSVRERS